MSDTRAAEIAAMLRRAVEIGDSLVAICDSVDQPIAGNHISRGVEILRATADMAADKVRHQASSSH